MKEVRFFYAPDAADKNELSKEEAQHVARVLRLEEGDPLMLIDGKGHLFEAVLTMVSNKHCSFKILSETKIAKTWTGHLHLAVAPTKNIDRIEWLLEKATEIGIDEISFLQCDFSERKVVKQERLEKIVVSAMKQSHKALKPQLNGLGKFSDVISEKREGQRFIAHCYDQDDLLKDHQKPFLLHELKPTEDAFVLIGPEGDFSVEEVKQAINEGFIPISLSKSRLRTETAALVAVHMMNLSHSL